MTILHYKFFKKIADLRVVDEIWLYGSRARGDNAQRSDIDIAILCPNASDINWSEIKDIVCKADTLLEIDCVRFDAFAEDATIRSEILRDKKVLYSKREGYMSEIYTGKSFEALGKAINSLKEVTEHNKDSCDRVTIMQRRGSMIQGFECTFELFWKVLKKYLMQIEGKETTGPKNVLSTAFSYKLIHDEKLWTDMLDDRNILSHTYDEDESKRVANRIEQYAEVMTKTYEKLKDAIKAAEGKI